MNLSLILFCMIIMLVIFEVNKIAFADEVAELLYIISMAESSGGKFLRGDNGYSLGKYQICAAVVEDYNLAHNTKFVHTDLLKNRNIDEKIARWHAERIVKRLKRRDIFSRAKFCQVWNEGWIAMQRSIPRTHKNKIYAGVYQRGEIFLK